MFHLKLDHCPMILYKTSVPHMKSHESKICIYLNDGHFFVLQSESGIRNICKLYVLSSKGIKFHPGCSHSQQITIEIKSFSIWHGGVGDSCRLQHLESPGSIPSRALFLGGDGYILFYFETWIADSFAYYLFSYYLFFD